MFALFVVSAVFCSVVVLSLFAGVFSFLLQATFDKDNANVKVKIGSEISYVMECLGGYKD